MGRTGFLEPRGHSLTLTSPLSLAVDERQMNCGAGYILIFLRLHFDFPYGEDAPSPLGMAFGAYHVSSMMALKRRCKKYFFWRSWLFCCSFLLFSLLRRYFRLFCTSPSSAHTVVVQGIDMGKGVPGFYCIFKF